MGFYSFLKFLFGVDDDKQKGDVSPAGVAATEGVDETTSLTEDVSDPDTEWVQLDEGSIKVELDQQIQDIEESHRREIEAFEARIKEFEEAKMHEVETREEQLVHAAEEKIQKIQEAKRRAEEERKKKIEEARQKAEEARRFAEEERARKEEEARKAAEEERKRLEEETRLRRLAEAEYQKRKEKEEDSKKSFEDVRARQGAEEKAGAAHKDKTEAGRAGEEAGVLSPGSSFLEKLRGVGVSVDDSATKKGMDNKLHSFLKKLRGREAEEEEKGKENQEKADLPGVGSILDVDIYQNLSEFIVYAQMPGVDMSTLEIVADKELDTVIIKGEKKPPEGFLNTQEKEGKYVVKDCAWGPVYRKIILPEEVDVYDSWAKLDRGVLILKLPLLRSQKDRAAQRKIKIIGEE